ncbi:hypothetical protein ES705_08641 [subsurface metagenome]
MKRLKKIPRFRNEEEERKFWATHDSTEYVEYSNAKKVVFQNLKPSVRIVSIRLPESLIAHLKLLANKRDIPYQSLMKIFLSERIKKELHSDKL